MSEQPPPVGRKEASINLLATVLAGEALPLEVLPLVPPALLKVVLDQPLYTPIVLHTMSHPQTGRLRKLAWQFDRYCPTCDRETHWATIPDRSELNRPDYDHWNGPFTLEQRCGRCQRTVRIFMRMSVPVHPGTDLESGPGSLVKVGQDPALAAFHGNDVKKFVGVTTEAQREDFMRAIQAASQGFSAGACTYLRRVFEAILDEARDQHMAANGLKEWPEYRRAGTADKIKFLRAELPAFMIENTRLYNLLSQGIHSLPDAECQELYPQLQEAIELIFEDRQDLIEKQKRRERTARFIKQADQPGK